MSHILALALATPLWGFALTPPTAAPLAITDTLADVEGPASGIDAQVLATTPVVDTSANDAAMNWTRGLTWGTTVAMAVTGVLGFIQFGDQYGFHDAYAHTACSQRTGVFNYCGEEVPIPHAIGAGVTATGLVASIVASTQVDFDAAARQDSDWRVYEVTRWVALGLGVAQALGGFFLANAVRFGWADQNADFATLQGLAIGHMALGAATLGMNVANSLLLF